MRRLLAGIGTVLVVCVACSQTPSNPTLTKALQAHSKGNITEATKLYQQVLVTDPANKYALYNLGLIAQTKGDLTTADTDYGKALTTDPNFVPALFNLAILRAKQKRTTDAITLYRKVLQIDPKNADAHLNLGYLLESNGQRREGQAELQEAVRIDSSLSKRIATPAPTAR